MFSCLQILRFLLSSLHIINEIVIQVKRDVNTGPVSSGCNVQAQTGQHCSGSERGLYPRGVESFGFLSCQLRAKLARNVANLQGLVWMQNRCGQGEGHPRDVVLVDLSCTSQNEEDFKWQSLEQLRMEYLLQYFHWQSYFRRRGIQNVCAHVLIVMTMDRMTVQYTA